MFQSLQSLAKLNQTAQSNETVSNTPTNNALIDVESNFFIDVDSNFLLIIQ